MVHNLFIVLGLLKIYKNDSESGMLGLRLTGENLTCYVLGFHVVSSSGYGTISRNKSINNVYFF
jgi:hypothetical protein